MNEKGLLSREDAALVIIDIQEKLFPLVAEKKKVLRNLRKIIQFAKIINMPIILTEQYPKGLGQTIPEIKELLPDIEPIEKIEFNSFHSKKFREAVESLGVKTLIIAGIEAHVCISQTSIEGVNNGYRVCVLSDAVSSRYPEDKEVALERMMQSGVIIASTEMVMFELLRKAGTREFKEVLEIIKA